jgi:hypothetical protein
MKTQTSKNPPSPFGIKRKVVGKGQLPQRRDFPPKFEKWF